MPELPLILVFALAASLVVYLWVRESNRRNDVWVESMLDLCRRCPACFGVGFYMAEGAPACTTCNGRGTLHGAPSPEAVGSCVT